MSFSATWLAPSWEAVGIGSASASSTGMILRCAGVLAVGCVALQRGPSVGPGKVASQRRPAFETLSVGADGRRAWCPPVWPGGVSRRGLPVLKTAFVDPSIENSVSELAEIIAELGSEDARSGPARGALM